ncbi:MAG: hypothetical protein WDZ68_00175, partial [Candidatus Paceibacterota bacterium]
IQGDALEVEISTLGKLSIIGRDSTDTLRLNVASADGAITEGVNHAILVSWDTAVGAMLYIDDVNVTVTNIVSVGNLDYSSASMLVGAGSGIDSGSLFRFELTATGNVIANFFVSDDTTPVGVAFSSDGTRMYVDGSSNDRIYQYPLSTPWDLRTVGATDANFSVSGISPQSQDLTFSSDGLNMYVVGSTSDRVWQYPLGTAWDLSTTGASIASFLVSGEDGTPTAVTFSSDGMRMYVLGFNTTNVYQYPLGTAWDLGTVGATDANFNVGVEEPGPQGITFSSDGMSMFITGSTNDTVHQYPLGTAWDLSTAGAVTTSFSVVSDDTGPRGITFSPDGTNMYIMGLSQRRVFQYPVGGDLLLNASLFEAYFNIETNIDFTVEANRRDFFEADGTPVDKGVNGETPTGVQPIMYLSGGAAQFDDNFGDGGTFTVNGTLEDSPVDAVVNNVSLFII